MGYIVSAAKSLAQDSRQKEALDLIGSELASTNDPTLSAVLYEGLAALYKEQGRHDLRAIALEKALTQKPNDIGLLFDAGYSFGQVHIEQLSMLHYKTILKHDDTHALALNNLGVQYDRLGLPIASVNLYKKAIEQNNLLSMANLSKKYIAAGFSEEASTLLGRATHEDALDPNVSEAISRLSSSKDEEKQQEESLVAEALKQQEFLKAFAEAYFTKADSANFTGLWKSGTSEFLINQDGNVISGSSKINNVEYRLNGESMNRGAIIKESYRNFLSSGVEITYTENKNKQIYAYLSQDGNNLLVMNLVSGFFERKIAVELFELAD